MVDKHKSQRICVVITSYTFAHEFIKRHLKVYKYLAFSLQAAAHPTIDALCECLACLLTCYLQYSVRESMYFKAFARWLDALPQIGITNIFAAEVLNLF